MSRASQTFIRILEQSWFFEETVKNYFFTAIKILTDKKYHDALSHLKIHLLEQSWMQEHEKTLF